MIGEQLSDRSSARVLAQPVKNLPEPANGQRRRDDSLEIAVATGGRVSPARRAAIQATLSDLDRQIVDSLAGVRLASGRQLQRLFFGDGEAAARRASRCLKRLTERRVLARLDRRIGGVRAGSAGFVYSLDVVGQAVAGLSGRRPWQLGAAFVAHGLLVTECLVRLHEAEASGAFHVAGFQTEPHCWLTFAGAVGMMTLKPDALAVIETGVYEDRWWLEVDNDTESPSRITRKALLYSQAYEMAATGDYPFPKVLWICTSATRERKLGATLRKLSRRDRELMAVCQLDNLANVIEDGPTAVRLEASDGGRP